LLARAVATALVLSTTFAPALRAQATVAAPATSLALVPAGVVAAPRPAVAIRRSVPDAWTRSLAREDSLAPRKRAFHVGAMVGVVASSAFVLALTQPWEGDHGEERATAGSTVAVAMLMAALPGAVLGGVAGVIVHDAAGAVTRR
jgi:hypothetical protein